MKFNWKQLENAYVKVAKRFLKTFCAEHPYEYFYGCSFDCNDEYWEILLSFNTEPLLLKTAERYKLKNAKLYPKESIEDLREMLRWEAGEWGYYLVFDPTAKNIATGDNPHYSLEYSQLIEKGKSLYEQIESWDDKCAIHERFMETACRIAIHLENDKAFQPLPRSKEFRVLCTEHNEDVFDGMERMRKVRRLVKAGK